MKTVVVFFKMVIRCGRAVTFSEVLIKKDLFWICHDCRFDKPAMRREQEVAVSGWFQRPCLECSCSCFVAFVFRMDVDG